ncbi:MAG: sugar ABC transporter permease [Endomicrobium sp.]|jgi:ABC-type sugar transport system permease subunit|nr:sugar ABC transporter permease [Endomicrobium sp.]
MKISYVEKIGIFCFVLPALLLFFAFNVYPVLKTLELSFFQWNNANKDVVFVGFAHYWHILFNNPKFWKAVLNAGCISLLAIILQNGFALFLALLINKNIKCGSVYKAIFLSPFVVSGVVAGLVWKFIFDSNFGILNKSLAIMGFTKFLGFAWLNQINTTIPSIAFAHMWKGLGCSFIVLLIGLQAIPVEFYEAAKVDGADGWQQFKHITFPLITPIYVVVTIFTILNSMKIFDLIYSMTKSSFAEVPITKIYHSVINGAPSYSAAMVVVFSILLLIIFLIYIFAYKKLSYKK